MNLKKSIISILPSIICISFIIILIIFFGVSNHLKVTRINNAFKIIENQNSNNEELQNSIDEIINLKNNIDCKKANKRDNRFYDFCINSDDYVQLAKTKILYNQPNGELDYDKYYELYSESNKISSDNIIFKEYVNDIKNNYYNFLIDKAINDDFLKVKEVTESLSGKSSVEFIVNRYGEKNFCISYSNIEFSNIYLFASAFEFSNIEDKMNNWLIMSLKEESDYNSKMIEYASNELANDNYNYNGEILTYDSAKTLLKNNIHRINFNGDCDELVSEGVEYITPPKIGMTKNEVLNGKWGTPNKVNKTTTIYGTKEQWVYSGYRYVYFDEYGLVTTIQD